MNTTLLLPHCASFRAALDRVRTPQSVPVFSLNLSTLVSPLGFVAVPDENSMEKKRHGNFAHKLGAQNV